MKARQSVRVTIGITLEDLAPDVARALVAEADRRKVHWTKLARELLFG